MNKEDPSELEISKYLQNIKTGGGMVIDETAWRKSQRVSVCAEGCIE